MITRIIWFIGLLGGAFFFREALACEDMHYLAGFAFALLSITFLEILVEVLITVFSARGTIIRVKPRRHIVHLLHIRVLLTLLEFVLLVVGTVLSVKSRQESDRKYCPNLGTAVTMMQAVIGAYWLSFVLFIMVVMIYLDPCHCYSAKVNYSHVTRLWQEGDIDQEVVETQWKLAHSVWEKRFKVACCLAGSDDIHQLAYREVAEIFAHLFCDTNVVMSDIAAGLVLLQKEQLIAEETERMNMLESVDNDEDPTSLFDFYNHEDMELFADIVYYMKYALGMYSWPVYMYMNPFCGLCRLYSHLHCRRQDVPNIHQDNRCSCYLGGLREITGIREVDIVYASFENEVYKVPFIVCLDHEKKAVVVAFRGTLSFVDIVTDLTASTRPIPVPKFPNFLVHKGMLKTITSILKKLTEERILETAFDNVNGYKLVIVGHSLGSGCAGIMSMLLREQYPDLRCFCYSPTGALFNEAAAAFSEEFITSITLGKDLVARLNVPNTHKLKEDLVRVIECCQKPKCRILFEGCLETISTCFGGSVLYEVDLRHGNNQNGYDTEEGHTDDENRDNTTIDHADTNPFIVPVDPENSLPISSHGSHPIRPAGQKRNSEVTPILLPKLSSLKLPVRSKERASNSPSPINSLTQEVERRLVPLFPPGKIIHIVDKSRNRKCFCDSRQLEVRWGSRHDFKHIAVSPDMIRDHFPDVLSRAMNKILRIKTEDVEIRRSHPRMSI